MFWLIVMSTDTNVHVYEAFNHFSLLLTSLNLSVHV